MTELIPSLNKSQPYTFYKDKLKVKWLSQKAMHALQELC